ncbi:GyrI-like domain-containing protein [Microbacterium aurantiacum]|uniref:GyrI-like domain-containing protein n=1 Tax=Microbacterium aurantiacum TaxID=162393 RepID=UPI003D717FBA
MISELNRLIEVVEADLSDDLDIGALAASFGTTEYHLRRMFASLVGMPLFEYVRRRRMTAAAADVIAGDPLLQVAVRFGYGSAEAFGRAFRAVHGAAPIEVRTNGGPLRSQPQLTLRLTVHGATSMDTRIVDRPAFRLVGHAARVPLIHRSANPHIQAHVASLPAHEHARLTALGNTDPHGLLQISADVDSDYTEGSTLTYLHGVARDAATTTPEGLDVIEVPAGTWAVFRASGPYPAALQETYAASASEWFPSNPWLLRPGPSIVAILDRAEDFRSATTELWLPIVRQRDDV